MIVGVGIDVVDIARFEETLARTPRLRERLFTPSEAALPMASLAARFAVLILQAHSQLQNLHFGLEDVILRGGGVLLTLHLIGNLNFVARIDDVRIFSQTLDGGIQSVVPNGLEIAKLELFGDARKMIARLDSVLGGHGWFTTSSTILWYEYPGTSPRNCRGRCR